MEDPIVEPTPVTVYDSIAEDQTNSLIPLDEASQFRLANLRERFAAFVTDHLILGGLLAAAILVYFKLTHQKNTFLLGSGSAVIYFLYFFCFEGVATATPGKMFAGLRLQKKNGEAPSIFAILIRNLLRLIDYPLFLLTGAGLAEGTKYHQRLGDLCAGTVLMKGLAPVLVVGPLRYAGTLRRGLAFLFDLILLVGFGYALLFAIPIERHHLSLILLNLTPLLILLYPVACEFLFQSSCGKALFGMQILTEEKTAPSLATVLLRKLLLPVDLNPLSYLFILLTKRKQRIGDLLTGTVVIINRRSFRSWLAIPFMLLIAGAVATAGYMNKQSFLKRDLTIQLASYPLPIFPPILSRYVEKPSLRLEALDLPGPLIRPGEMVSIKMGISGFKTQRNRALLQVDLSVRSPQGELVLNAPNILNADTPVNWHRYVELTTRFALHPRALPGRYQVEITLRDRLGDQQVRSVKAFQVL